MTVHGCISGQADWVLEGFFSVLAVICLCFGVIVLDYYATVL
jgi:hypothetical protein